MKNKISVIIAAFNDQEVIEEALKSVVWADEIIVVLSENSADKTYSIVKQFTTKIYRTINHLGRQRQYGIQYAIGDWILILDTDERVSADLRDEIRTKLLEDNGNIVFHG